MKDLPISVQNDIQEFALENDKGNLPDSMELESALGMYLEWNGILGWTRVIMEIIHAAR